MPRWAGRSGTPRRKDAGPTHTPTTPTRTTEARRTRASGGGRTRPPTERGGVIEPRPRGDARAARRSASRASVGIRLEATTRGS